jgi:hypothetical protein
MNSGIAPLGPDNKSINLHHMTQMHKGPIAELTQSFHQKHTKIIHINPNSISSNIERCNFTSWKRAYWKSRAADFS